MRIKNKNDYTLGHLPWEDEFLKKEYYKDMVRVQNAIKEHPGFFSHAALLQLKSSLEIFFDCVDDLLASIKLFRTASQNAKFWHRPSRVVLLQKERAVCKGVFTAATSAMVIVEASRRITKRIIISGYEEKKEHFFEKDEVHRFIQDLRNFFSHHHIVQPDWRKHWTSEGSVTEFILSKNILLSWNKWTRLSKKFIDSHEEGINIEKLFLTYRQKVDQFHKWFHDEIKRISEPDISDYRKYEALLKRFEARTWWRLILNEAIKRNINPYDHLNEYFTPAEMKKIKLLPHKSVQQINRMVEILDEFNTCDDEMRRLVYTLFKINVERRHADV